MRTWRPLAALAILAASLLTVGGPASAAPPPHVITFVNHTGATIWIGSTVNADGSTAFVSLPMLADGQSAAKAIPETNSPYHWRGTFFARQRCSGVSGSTFHCLVGDCGRYASHCVTGEQPASLAEFNFDRSDGLAPWYDVSYVNAVSVPITITPSGVPVPPPGTRPCSTAGCPGELLSACPAANLRRAPDGSPMLCVNPARDSKTAYSNAITARCPRAYTWSRQDTEPGNQTVFDCPACSGFTITFH